MALSILSRSTRSLRNFSLPVRATGLSLAMLAGPIAYRYSLPATVSAATIASDYTASNGENSFTNEIKPYSNAAVLAVEPGTYLDFTFIGGVNKPLHAKVLTPVSKDDLISKITSTEMLPPTVKGSDVTTYLLAKAKSLKERPEAGRKILIEIGDAQDDKIKSIPKFAPGSAAGVEVYLLFSRNSKPLCADALRGAGATVVIAQSQAQATAALQRAFAGETPAKTKTRWAALALWELALLGALALAFRGKWRERKLMLRERAVAEAQAQSDRHKAEEKARLDAEKREAMREAKKVKFAPQTISVAAVLNGQQRIVRSLQVGSDDGFLITGENASKGDLKIANSLLGTSSNVAAMVSATDASTLLIENLGQETLVLGNGQALTAGQGALIPIRDGALLISRAAKVRFFDGAETTGEDDNDNFSNGSSTSKHQEVSLFGGF